MLSGRILALFLTSSPPRIQELLEGASSRPQVGHEWVKLGFLHLATVDPGGWLSLGGGDWPMHWRLRAPSCSPPTRCRSWPQSPSHEKGQTRITEFSPARGACCRAKDGFRHRHLGMGREGGTPLGKTCFSILKTRRKVFSFCGTHGDGTNLGRGWSGGGVALTLPRAALPADLVPHEALPALTA